MRLFVLSSSHLLPRSAFAQDCSLLRRHCTKQGMVSSNEGGASESIKYKLIRSHHYCNTQYTMPRHATTNYATPCHGKPRHATPSHSRATPQYVKPRHNHDTNLYAKPHQTTAQPHQATAEHATPKPCHCMVHILLSTDVDNAMGTTTRIAATSRAHILMPDICWFKVGGVL